MLTQSKIRHQNNNVHKNDSFNKYSNTRFNIGYYHFNDIAYMVRSCVGPFDFTYEKMHGDKNNNLDKFLAYLLGVMEWHNDNYIFNNNLSHELNAERFVKFIKYYTINILIDSDDFIFDKLIQLITNNIYPNNNDDGYKAAADFHNNKNIFAGNLH